MSKPNLPPLPSPPKHRGHAMYAGSQMIAYAEEAVRQALAAQVPVAYLHTSNRTLTWPGKLNEVQLASGVWRALYEHPAASGHNPAPVDTSSGHSTVEQAAIRQALKGMQRWFGKWPEFVPADDKVTDAAQAVAAMNAVLPETRDG